MVIPTLQNFGIGGRDLTEGGTKPAPIRLNPIGGAKLPMNSNVISQVIFNTWGIPLNVPFLVTINREEDHPDYGPQYSYVAMPDMKEGSIIASKVKETINTGGFGVTTATVATAEGHQEAEHVQTEATVSAEEAIEEEEISDDAPAE